jgi:putative transposase
VKLSYNYPNQKQAEKLRSNFSFRKKRLIIEKLNVRSMLEAKGFEINKENIQDASWARFASILFYKAERAGRIIIEVDPRNTSKTCSGCSNIRENLILQDRQYHCDACGIAMDRDINAAINIKRLGTSLATDKTVSEAHGFSHG